MWIIAGAKELKTNKFSIFNWNLNSSSAHDFSKLTQLKAYDSIYKYDFICLSETHLDSPIPDNLIDIKGCKLICVDHPDNIKRGGVSIYYKESLSVQVISLPYFKESLFLEMSSNKKSNGFCYLSFP